MGDTKTGQDMKHIKDQLYQLIIGQLMFDTHTSLAEGVRAVCSLKSELCNASADLLYLLYPILVNKADAGVQCDILSNDASTTREFQFYEMNELDDGEQQRRKSILDAMTQTTPLESKNNVDMETTIDEGKAIKRKRGRPRKTGEPGISRSKARRKIYQNVKIKKEETEAKDRLSLSESKRKQSNPQKVVSPDTDSKDKDAFDGEEELPEGECEEEKDAEPNDEEWKPEVSEESLKLKKKRGRKPKVKKEPAEPKPEQEVFHLGRPHGKRHTTCYGCDQTFAKSTDCHIHVLSHFIETETQKICKICNKTLAKSTMHQDHLKIHSTISSFLCNVCGATFNRKSSYDNHMEKHSRKKLYCDKCSNGPYNTVKQYERHIAVFHGGQLVKKWMCDVCGKGFYQKNKLDSHVRIHTGERPYTCSFCPATFRCKPHVQRHEEQHKGKKRFTCGVCNHATFQRSNMKVHMRVHSAVSYAETKLFVCALCRSCFHTVELFELHKSSKHPNYEQDMDALTDTIGIGKIKMLINPPGRIQSPSKPSEVTQSSQENKPKRAPRVRMKTVHGSKTEEPDNGSTTGAAQNTMVEEINCMNTAQGPVIALQGQQPLSQPQHTEMTTSNLTNSSVINVNSFSAPTSSIQQALYSAGPHQSVQSTNSTGGPMDYSVATDYSMLMQTVAAAHVGGTNAPSSIHPSFLQQHHHFSNMH